MPQDIWEYKDPQNPQYPTEKNAAKLARIIETSSNLGDTVLDCYAGSGATLLQAVALGRLFIGMDNSPVALAVMTRLFDVAGVDYDLMEMGEQDGRTVAAA